MPAETAIILRNIRFHYPSEPNNPVLAISDWQINTSETVFLNGPSGSGKSTLLNLIAGTLKPQRGEVRLLDQAFSTLLSGKRDRFRALHLGIVFQQFNLIPYLNVRENIALAAHFSRQKEDLGQRVEHLLERLQLPQALGDKAAGELSVGQQQRVAIARALINQPEILIADEPTSALDASAKQAFMTLLLDCVKESGSVLLFVSHDQSLGSFFDRVCQIHEINQAGSLEHAD